MLKRGPSLLLLQVCDYSYRGWSNYFCIGLTALAQALDSKQAHTSFGKLPLSNEATAPNYNFPKAKRDEGQKLYIGELTKIENTGK
jgi:hypothetical protein